MNTRSSKATKLITLLVPFVFAMAVMIYRTENGTYHHDMGFGVALMLAAVLGLIVAPFAYRYVRDSSR